MATASPVAQEIDDVLVRWDYDSATRRYQGHASPGTTAANDKWRIKRLTLDAQGRLTLTEFADGNANFDNVWNNRTTLTYS